MKKILTSFIALATVVVSANAMSYQQFRAGRGGTILQNIAANETIPVSDEQAMELFMLSRSLRGGILTVRSALIESFENGTSETESITDIQSERVSELYGKLIELSNKMRHP